MPNPFKCLTDPKSALLALFLLCCFLLGFGYFLEYYYHYAPCPLCLTQRYCFMLIGISALIRLIVPSKRQTSHRFTFFLISLFAAIGAALAGRQIWLQHLPEDKVPSCGPDLAFLIEEFPLSDVLHAMFIGDGNCAEEVWDLFGLNIPDWSLLAFAGIFLLATFRIFSTPKANGKT